MDQPLVSMIVTTKNNHATLPACLDSIRRQSYPRTELIIVDNYSADDTKTIALGYTGRVLEKGPERSAQRNFGVQQARGTYVLIIDSDMELAEDVVAACVAHAAAEPAGGAIIIPEESFGRGFWAQCKRLERSFYVGQDTIEAARFFNRQLYEQLGGYDEGLTGGEDWDLTRRARRLTSIGRVASFIRHNEGRPRFTRTVRKMYYYSHAAAAFFGCNPGGTPLTDPSGPLARYKLFFSRPGRLFRNPLLGLGMLTLKTAEYAAGGLGYYQARRAAARGGDDA